MLLGRKSGEIGQNNGRTLQANAEQDSNLRRFAFSWKYWRGFAFQPRALGKDAETFFPQGGGGADPLKSAFLGLPDPGKLRIVELGALAPVVLAPEESR